MNINKEFKESLTFGFEQTLTIPNWWSDEGFGATSDTPLKREKMLALAIALADVMQGSYKESRDIWNHLQYETFDKDGKQSFYVTMDPGSIEVKTPPVLFVDLEEMIRPLFIAAEKCELVPYRNWWYGVKGASEGGCHVNLGGFSPETNPLKKNPELVIKYCAYIHNRPWLHYPFMGPDVGPEGNCQRMDEKDNYQFTKEKLESIDLNSVKAEDVYPYFEQTNLISDKCSFPSLKKFKGPDYFLEDRAQEALRSGEDFTLVALLRLCIFSELLESELEKLKTFNNLHQELLTSFYLWDKFVSWAKEREIDALPFQRFFERQFPTIEYGEKPKSFALKEGRRPRKILDVKMNNGVAVSKTIDTSYKRFEIFCFRETEIDFKIENTGIETISNIYQSEDTKYLYLYLDIKVDKEFPELKIKKYKKNDLVELKIFHLNDMKWLS